MKKIFIILLFFISSCDYQPIYVNNNSKNLEFSEIIFEGDNRINRQIINSLSFKENKNDNSLNKLLLKTTFVVEETSKNSKGQIESYRTSILVNLTISKNKKILKKKDFFEDFTYNNKENKFELVEYQDSVKNNIINKIIEEITLYINL